MNDQPTSNDILQAIQGLKGDIAQINSRIGDVEIRLGTRIDGVEVTLLSKIDAVHTELLEVIGDLSTETDRRFTELDGKIDRRRAEMPTKDYIDRKFADYDAESTARAERMFVRR